MRGISHARQRCLTECTEYAGRRGTALVASMLCLSVMAALAVSFVSLLTAQSAALSVRRQSRRARHIAEVGVNVAIGELNSERDYDDNGLGNAADQFDGGGFHVTAEENAERDYTLTAVGSYGLERRAIEVVVQRLSAELSCSAPAAITANGPVCTTGNFLVDGRDHSLDGVLLPDPGVWGIVCMADVKISGNSRVGGLGKAPVKTDDLVAQGYSWADHVDNDGDGAVDEEAFDGIDNDADGRIDEDPDSFPSGPDVAVGVPPGPLKLVAQSNGTYFTTSADFEAYLCEHGDVMPGGEIIYLEVDEFLPAHLGSTMNEVPSLLIVHNSTGTSQMKNLKGMFKGLILADDVVHINSNTFLLGALMSFSAESFGTPTGNGTASILYSSEVLAELPADLLSAHYLVRSWREVSAAAPAAPVH